MGNSLKAGCTAQFCGWFCAAFTQWVNKISFEVTSSIQAYVKCHPMTTYNSELQHNITALHVCFHCITASVAQAKVTVDLQKHREAQVHNFARSVSLKSKNFLNINTDYFPKDCFNAIDFASIRHWGGGQQSGLRCLIVLLLQASSFTEHKKRYRTVSSA